MMRRHSGTWLFLLLAALGAPPGQASGVAASDSAAVLLAAGRSAARAARWDDAERRAREALVALPALDPAPAVLDGAFDLAVLARMRRGADGLEAVAALDTLALQIYQASRFVTAARILERSLAHRETTLVDMDFIGARCEHLLGNVIFDLGDHERSGEHYRRATEVYERLGSPRASMTRFNLGNVALVLGDLAGARGWYLQVLEEARARRDSSAISDVYLNLSNVLGRLGDPLGARRALEDCIAVRRRLGKPPDWIAGPFINLAGTYLSTGDPARALALLDSAAHHYRGSLPDDHPEWGILAHSRSDALARLGRHGDALAEARHCLAFRERVFGAEHPDVADAHLLLARALRERGDHDEALRHVQRARDMDRSRLTPDHPRLAENQRTLAEARLAVGDSAEALELAIEAESRLRSHLRLTAPGLDEAEALRRDQTRRGAADLALELLAGDAAPATVAAVYEALIQSRAGVLDLQVSRLRSLGEGPEVDRLRARYERACTRLANRVVRGPGPLDPAQHQARLDSAQAERHAAELALTARSAAWQRQRQGRSLGIGDLQGALPPGAVLVSYVRHQAGAGPRDAAFVLRATGAPRFVALGAARVTDSLVANVRAAMEARPSARSEQAYQAVAGTLRRRVWDPLRSSLAGARQVFVVPDGALQLVNFAALPVEDGRYLVETGPELVLLGAERDLMPVRSEREPGRGLLVVGGVDFERSAPGGATEDATVAAFGGSRPPYRGPRSECTDFSSLALAPLPGSLRELEAVRDTWRRHAFAADTVVRALAGTVASEERFKRLAGGHRVVHVATHGFFFQPDCPPARDEVRYPTTPLRHESALLRSGLALAGFNRRGAAPADGEDGVLTAAEVAALDLAGVECVVLSACESGAGDLVAGEGVFGLRRAFLLAGAPTVVTSPIRVRDVPARAWTEAFYDHFARGVPAARAAASASRALLDRARRLGRGTHPAEWGAFLAIGGWR